MDNRELDALEPKEVFRFFREISRIPRGSYHIEEISAYLAEFAKERGLECHQDGEGNVIIIKEASPGYEEVPAIMLQGHMDMVAVKEAGSSHDLLKDPLDLFVEGDELGARSTSLGGDDGVAVAYALALLDDSGFSHPRLECVFTVNEETGMEGARAIDLAPCKALRMLNLDSGEEGHFLAGCAGGVKAYGSLKVNRESMIGIKGTVTISGLHGGHSGELIHKGYANALILMGRLCRRVFMETGCRLVSLSGGEADNAIPRDAEATFLLGAEAISEGAQEHLARFVSLLEEEWAIEWSAKETDLHIGISFEERQSHENVLTAESMGTLTAMLFAMPDGVQAMSGEVPGLVETSLNLGRATLSESEFSFISLIRSSKDKAKEEVCRKLEAIMSLAGGSLTLEGNYPGWQFRANSPFRDSLVALYKEMTGEEGVVEAIHAGLECGLFLEKRPELDCVSIGPNMRGIHTVEERLSISSTERVYKLVKGFLQIR